MYSWLIPLFVAAGSLVEPLSDADRTWDTNTVKTMTAYKYGPYDGVMWFCHDGTVFEPKWYLCKDHGGGEQYGVLSEATHRLAKDGIYVGTILAAIKPGELPADNFYRARALLIERYLERALDGWVVKSARAAKEMRGFRQEEDERKFARTLLMELMGYREMRNENRYLSIRLIRSLPYGQDENLADQMRELAGQLGDTDPAFRDLRYKIHSMPEPTDIAAVEAYAQKAKPQFAETTQKLLTTLRSVYDPAVGRARLKELAQQIVYPPTRDAIAAFLAAPAGDVTALLTLGNQTITSAQRTIFPAHTETQEERNLWGMQVMSLVETQWVQATADLSRAALTRAQALDLVGQLMDGAQGLGLLSERETAQAHTNLTLAKSGQSDAYITGISRLGMALDWARAKVAYDLGIPLARYQAIEPRSRDAIDDILRSGLSLPLAAILDRLNADAEKLRGSGDKLVGLGDLNTKEVRGLNPGIAAGNLREITFDTDTSALQRSEIALLDDLPPELPPVSGLITTGPTGSLAHMALLARNLAIPHASVSSEIAAALRTHAGQSALLGVSVGRQVLLGPLADFPADVQAAMVKPKEPEKPVFSIDVDKLDLKTAQVLPISAISVEDKGVRVGPKAAEVGHLKKLFPDRVSDAVVLPFGLFVQHVTRPGKNGAPSPLDNLKEAYVQAANLPTDKADAYVLAALAQMRQDIMTLPFAPGFSDAVWAGLKTMGWPGTFGVYVRSDTNVEDLKDFTGAGLNLTVFNQVSFEHILKAIREVWASPFAERSYRWRQRLLSNPEQVYPSVLLHKTVPSAISGVMVTADMQTGSLDGLTISVSEGVSAVVDGGAPETWLVKKDGTITLLASSRTPTRKFVPRPPAEGTVLMAAEGTDPLLTDALMTQVRKLASEVIEKMPPSDTPWDIEFGISYGKVYLLQIRPLRTAKAPATNPLLVALDKSVAQADAALDINAVLP